MQCPAFLLTCETETAYRILVRQRKAQTLGVVVHFFSAEKRQAFRETPKNFAWFVASIRMGNPWQDVCAIQGCAKDRSAYENIAY